MSTADRPAPTVLRRPAQGWSSLLLLLGMLVLVGVSVAQARLLGLAATGLSSSLIVLMVAGGLVGYVLARSSLGIVRAHLIGAAVGAALILLIAGAAIGDRGGVLPGSVHELREMMSLLYAQVQSDVRSADLSSDYVPSVVVHLVLGAVCWTTAQFSAFSIFRHNRGGPAVVAIGVLLFLNLYLASWRADAELLPMLPQLALFAALAMLTLMRLQLTQQRYQWARRHIADTGEVSRLFLRSGAFFVAFSVVGASSLTLAASTGPHDFDLAELGDGLDDLGNEVSRWLPFLAVPRDPDQPRSLGDGFSIPDSWQPPAGTAFTAVVDGDLAGNYWFMSASDQFNGWTWGTAAPKTKRLDPNEEFEMTPGRGKGPWEPLDASITVDALEFSQTVASPADPYLVADQPIELTLLDSRGGVGRVDFQAGPDAPELYDVSAMVRDYGDSSGALTADELRSAGTGYPEWVLERYLQGAGDAAISGALTQERADQIRDSWTNAYDRAVAAQNLLRRMTYTTTDLARICDGLNVPECVLTYHQGFCQYYASTMVMLLREMGIPSRIVRGFLPGEQADDGMWVVPNEAFHAWTEAFFPGYGWVRFDPTPPTPALLDMGQARTDLVDDDPDASARPERTEAPPERPDPTGPPDPSGSPSADLGTTDVCDVDCPGDDDGVLPALLVSGGIAGLILVVMGSLLFLRQRRSPLTDGATAYRSMVRLATRLGHGPHPAQTEYEYAASLSVTLPSVQDDLYMVAASRVETTYGRRGLDDDRRISLRRAYRRIRNALLRLSLRLRRSG